MGIEYSVGEIPVTVTESVPWKIQFLPIYFEVHSVGMGDQITASKLRLKWGMLFMLIVYMAFHVSIFVTDFIIFKHLLFYKT